MSKVRMTGFDDLQRQLKQMERAAKKLNGTHEVPYSKLFTPDFMRKNTKCKSFNDILQACGLNEYTQEAFDELDEKLLDQQIRKLTKFRSWEEMQQKAMDAYITKQLGF